jgi:hypothetical protein
MNITVTLTPELRLAEALIQAGIEDPAAVSQLTIFGLVNRYDLWYIRTNMAKTLRILDMGNASMRDKEIENNAFSGCVGLTSIIIPDSVYFFGLWAFYGCTGLTSFYVPKLVEGIEKNTFSGCTGLTDITVHPDNLNYASENGILYNKDKTEPIFSHGEPQDTSSPLIADYNLFPDSMTEIGEGTISEGYNIISLTIPKSITKIGDKAFAGFHQLTSIAIPASVTEIGEFVFSGCSSLIDIAVNPDNPAYSSEGGVLFNKDKTELIAFPASRLVEYTVPDSVTKIRKAAFYCACLSSVTIPDSVTSIENSTFYCSSLVSIIIPDSVKKIGDYAFF